MYDQPPISPAEYREYNIMLDYKIVYKRIYALIQTIDFIIWLPLKTKS